MRKNLFQQLLSCLERGERFAVATVIFRSGSGPRETGATMLIRTGGETVGTIGGGVLEAKVLKMAEEVLRKS
jgi:xanthine dehydrogenase accessory factor